MDNKKRGKIILKVLCRIYKEYLNKEQFIDKCLVEVCFRENVIVEQAYFILVLVLKTVFVVGICYCFFKKKVSSCFMV